MTDELEAAVERVSQDVAVSKSIWEGAPLHPICIGAVRPLGRVSFTWADLEALLHALAEANERASLLQTALAASEARRGEMEAKAKAKLGVGMVIAAQIGFSSHGCSVTAEEILCCSGLDTAEKMRRIGVDKYDIERLRPVLRDIAQRKRNNRAKRLNPQQEGSRDHG